MTVLTEYPYYFRRIFEDRARVVEEAHALLADVEYDTLVGTGMSGALFVPQLAEELGKKWAIVRKESDDTHAYGKIIGELGEHYVFVDDFVETGDTLKHVTGTIIQQTRESEYVGVLENEHASFRPHPNGPKRYAHRNEDGELHVSSRPRGMDEYLSAVL